jgi:hypothetical protein
MHRHRRSSGIACKHLCQARKKKPTWKSIEDAVGVQQQAKKQAQECMHHVEGMQRTLQQVCQAGSEEQQLHWG